VTRFDLSLFDRINLWGDQNRYLKRDTRSAKSPCQKQPPFPLVPVRTQIDRDKTCTIYLAGGQGAERKLPKAMEPPTGRTSWSGYRVR
jgi:hypothetical protein